MEIPKAVVATSLGEFMEICRKRGWNYRSVRYISLREAKDKLVGYNPEDVYPAWVAARLSDGRFDTD